MPKALLIVFAALAAGLLVALLYGSYRWNVRTRQFDGRLKAARIPIQPKVVDFGELESLPPVVQRYFRLALKEGQPMVVGVRVQHKGIFNLGKADDQWKRFSSNQKVVTQRPGFIWNGRIAIMPGLPVQVHDAYIAGEGLLQASLLGLFTLADLHGPGDVAKSELIRFFAEAAWYPTALLPSQGVHWEAVNNNSANATLTEGAISITVLFTFDDEGLIDTVGTEARGRTVGDKIVPTPWLGRFWNYYEAGGMRVPLNGEVSWVLLEGIKPYWRGYITALDYEFAQ